jgi:steroid delta-isomerase
MNKHEVAVKYLEGLTNADLEQVLSLFDENAKLQDPVGGDINLQGMEQIRAFYAKSVTMGLVGKLQGNVRVAGNSIAFAFEMQINKPDEGPALFFEAIDVFELNDAGKIIDMKAYWGPENIKMLG